MSSADGQNGSHTSGSHGHSRRKGSSSKHRGRRLAESSTSNDSSHVNDRLSCELLRSDLTTRDYSGAASETLHRFDQIYGPSYGAGGCTDVHHAVNRTMYPDSIHIECPPTRPEADRNINSHHNAARGSRRRQHRSLVHGNDHRHTDVAAYGDAREHGVDPGHDVHRGYDHDQGSTNTPAYDHNMMDEYDTVVSHGTRHNYRTADESTGVQGPGTTHGSVSGSGLDWNGHYSQHQDPAFYHRRP